MPCILCWLDALEIATFAQLKRTVVEGEVHIVENGMQWVSRVAIEDFKLLVGSCEFGNGGVWKQRMQENLGDRERNRRTLRRLSSG